jgi:transketolase
MLRATIWSVPVLTNFASRKVLDIGRCHQRLFVFEEHSSLQGLGSAVAEVVAEFGGCPVSRIGIEKRFSEPCGSYDFLLRYHGLSLDSMETRIKRILADDGVQVHRIA